MRCQAADPAARFVGWDVVRARFEGKRVAVVGSAPSVLKNRVGYIESFDVVVRVNNYKVGRNQGTRTDVHYSFYGASIKKTRAELAAHGVTLCMCKCPNGKPIESAWHERHGKVNGIDFRWIYRNRAPFWFCDTFVPDLAHFRAGFELLAGHVPTTGFAAILDVLACAPRRVYLTGFDFFESKKHNVNERWRPGDPADPIGHRPDLEAAWLVANAKKHPLKLDATLAEHLRQLPA